MRGTEIDKQGRVNLMRKGLLPEDRKKDAHKDGEHNEHGNKGAGHNDEE